MPQHPTPVGNLRRGITKLGFTVKELIVSLLVVCVATVMGLWAVNWFDLGWSSIEVLATTTGAVSVWLLAKNRPLGWWIGLISVAAFLWVFFTVELYGEVAVQMFYLVTSVQAIWIWMRGGSNHGERIVSHVPHKIAFITLGLFLVGWASAWWLLTVVNGAAPMWDSLTTVMSVTATFWLVWRYAQAWWIWVAVDLIYIPLYLSRGLKLTAALYVGFLLMATMGLISFWKEAQENDRVVGNENAGLNDSQLKEVDL